MRRLRRAARLRITFLAPLIALLIRALAATWRVRFEGEEPWDRDDARLGAIWHCNLLAAAGVFRGRPLHVTVSRSRDGEIAVSVMRHLGFAEPPRGSSRRGAVSLLREVVRLARSGRQTIIPVDGPVGPARIAKAGAVQAARLAGVPLFTAGIAAHPCVRFRSWDRLVLPLPFAQVVCIYGEPLKVPAKASGAEIEALRAELQRRLEALTGAAESAARRSAG